MLRTTPVRALLLALALSTGCAREVTTAEGSAGRKIEPVPVRVVPVSTATVERTAPLVGAFYANEEVTVAAQIEARVSSIGPDMGDRVSAGEVLVTLDDADLQAELREVEARVAKAHADNARAQLLSAKGIMAVEEAEKMRTEAAVFEAQRDVLRVKLARTVIRAPLTGAVAARDVSAGEIVKSGSALYRLVQDDPLKFRTPIPERFAGSLRLGQTIRVTVDAYPGRIFSGQVTRINPTSDAANRSITVEALVQNHEALLKPGFFAKGDLVYDQQGEALIVPESALTTFAGVTKLFVVKDGKAEERVVRPGVALAEGRREIVDGIVWGEQVAASNVERLEQGAPVSAQP
jgi:membrane fusion protein (multidrug efflux system)